MSSFHFYEASNKNMDEIFEILNEFEKEAPALDYPHIHRAKDETNFDDVFTKR